MPEQLPWPLLEHALLLLTASAAAHQCLQLLLMPLLCVTKQLPCCVLMWPLLLLMQ
jgi:hypothetical protein